MTKPEILTIIIRHYNSELSRLQITSAKTSENEVNLDKYKHNVNSIRERLKVKLKANGVCSDLLIEQLARHIGGLGEAFENKRGTGLLKYVEFYNALEILELIEMVESDKKSGDKFKREPLSGLYKIHHNAYSGIGYSLIKNIRDYWFGSDNNLLAKRTSEFNAILQETGLNQLANTLNKMHDKAVYSKELRGEWLIYKVHKKINYFLCLAIHEEGDEAIFETKIKRCLKQYPELIDP